MSTEFEKLVGELEVLAKAQSDEDKKVVASADDAGVDTDSFGGEGGETEGDEPDMDEDEGFVDSSEFGKSFTVLDDHGNASQGFDATELIKSMDERLSGLDVLAAEDAQRREHLGKSMSLMLDLIKSQSEQLKAQGEQIAALGKSLGEVGRQGVGRRAVLSVSEKPDTMAKAAHPEGLDGKSFMAKAMEAFAARRISAVDVSIAESSLNRGVPVDAGIVSRVMGNQ